MHHAIVMRFAHPFLPLAFSIAAAAACGSGSQSSLPGDSAPLAEFQAPNASRGAPCGTQNGEVPCTPTGPGAGAGGAGADAGSGAPASEGGAPEASTNAPEAAPQTCVPPDVFGASAWNDRFDFEALLATQKVVSVHGEACLDCHANPAAPEIPRFDFGGRVLDPSGHPAANVEVRVTHTQSGQPIAAYSNADGYFWWPPPPIDEGGYDDDTVEHDVALFPSAVGARTQQGATVAMCAQANGNCGSCHKESTMPIKTK